jgi:hypothetical protein
MLTGRVAIVYAPHGGGSFPQRETRLANATGSTESHNTTALAEGTQAALIVGSVPVRFRMRSAAGLSNVISATGTTAAVVLPAYGRFDWEVQTETKYCYVQAADNSTAYEAWVWQAGA